MLQRHSSRRNKLDKAVLNQRLYGAQSYIEDCQVCCRSIELGLDVVDGALQGVTARRIDGV